MNLNTREVNIQFEIPSQTSSMLHDMYGGKKPTNADKPSRIVGDEDVSLSFPQRLMEVLDDESYSDIISWIGSGESFVIHDRKRFTEEILPKHFNKSSKYSSFARKLNRWCFSRVSKGPDTGAYYHALFKKGGHKLLSQMSCQITPAAQAPPGLSPPRVVHPLPRSMAPAHQRGTPSLQPPTNVQAQGSASAKDAAAVSAADPNASMMVRDDFSSDTPRSSYFAGDLLRRHLVLEPNLPLSQQPERPVWPASLEQEINRQLQGQWQIELNLSDYVLRGSFAGDSVLPFQLRNNGAMGNQTLARSLANQPTMQLPFLNSGQASGGSYSFPSQPNQTQAVGWSQHQPFQQPIGQSLFPSDLGRAAQPVNASGAGPLFVQGERGSGAGGLSQYLLAQYMPSLPSPSSFPAVSMTGLPRSATQSSSVAGPADKDHEGDYGERKVPARKTR